MDKKIISIILIFVIALIGIGFLMTNSQQLEIGDVYFQVPSEYDVNEGPLNVNVTSNDASITIIKNQTKNLNKTMNNYIKMKESKNIPIQVTKLNTNNITIYKTNVVNSTTTIHYWFELKGKTYEMYAWHGNQNTDNLALELINSLKTK